MISLDEYAINKTKLLQLHCESNGNHFKNENYKSQSKKSSLDNCEMPIIYFPFNKSESTQRARAPLMPPYTKSLRPDYTMHVYCVYCVCVACDSVWHLILRSFILHDISFRNIIPLGGAYSKCFAVYHKKRSKIIDSRCRHDQVQSYVISFVNLIYNI